MINDDQHPEFFGQYQMPLIKLYLQDRNYQTAAFAVAYVKIK